MNGRIAMALHKEAVVEMDEDWRLRVKKSKSADSRTGLGNDRSPLFQFHAILFSTHCLSTIPAFLHWDSWLDCVR